MTRDDLVAQLAAIERRLANRIVIVRTIVNPDLTIAARIYRIVQRPPDSRVREPQHTGDTHHE